MANLIQATIYQIDGNPQASAISIDFLTSELVIREAEISTIPAVQSAILYYNVVNNQQSVQTYYAGETVATLVALANNGETSHTQATVLEINGDPQIPGGVQYSFPSASILIGQSINPATGVNAFIQYKGIRYFTSETQATLYNNSNAGGGGGIIVPGSGLNSSMRCGVNNTASATYSTVFGRCNTASGCYASVSGGGANCAVNDMTSVNGANNVAFVKNSNIIGGVMNTIAFDACSVSASGYLDFSGYLQCGVLTLNSCVGNQTGYFTPGSIVSISGSYDAPNNCCYSNLIVCNSCYNPATCKTTVCLNQPITDYNANYLVKRSFSCCSMGPYDYDTPTANVIIGGGRNTISSGYNGNAIVGGYLNTISSGYFNIVSGKQNTSSGYYSAMFGGDNININTGYSIVSGQGNCLNNGFSGVVFGIQNTYSGYMSSILGGCNNVVSNYSRRSVIAGGGANTISSDDNTISGGRQNIISGYRSVISGGSFNTVSGFYAVVSGGGSNVASGCRSIVGGGAYNTASGCTSTISGGYSNLTQAWGAFIGSGNGNKVCGGSAAYGAVVVGGVGNNTTGGTWYGTFWDTTGQVICNAGAYSFVGGGFQNRATANCSAIVGGFNNSTTGQCAFIGAGECNIASNARTFIGGGKGNTASGSVSSVLGQTNIASGTVSIAFGSTHTASGNWSGVTSGYKSTSSGNYSTVSGGYCNIASGTCSFIGSGRANIASGASSGILAGNSNNTNALACAMIVGSGITADRANTTFVNNLSIKSIPTDATGLPAGSVWNNGGVLNIV